MKQNHKQRYRVIQIILQIAIILFSSTAIAETIYVSSSGNDANDGTMESPVLTLKKAKDLCSLSSDPSFTILLKGGDVFTEHIGTKSNFDGDRVCAFIWDIDKPLTISTYGPDEKAHLYGGFYRHNGGPVAAILIIEPSTQDVLIENLSFEMWQESTIIVFETEDVTIRNIKINRVGTYYFTDQKDDAFMPAVVYPKNSKRILMDNIEMHNGHNIDGDRDGLHGFYCTRLADSEIRNCLMTNISGSAFKVRRENRDVVPNNIYIHDNECYYTGTNNLTPEHDAVQPGFLRLSGEFYNDGSPNCPSGIVIENNILHYPFCWNNEGEDCSSVNGYLCSTSNQSACGENACEDDTSRVKWIDNDIIFEWKESEYWIPRNTIAPSKPTEFSVLAVNDNQIDLSWKHDMLNGERFIIYRKNEWSSFTPLRIVGADINSYSDKNLSDSTLYTYRIKACRDAACSDFSNEATDSTSGGVSVPAPSFLFASAKDKAIDLRWRDTARNEQGFFVERKDANSDYSIIDTLAANITFYSDTLVEPSISYHYRVRAFRYNVTSNYSNEATAIISSVRDDRTRLPQEFSLEPNYPNPFNPSTTIRYQISKSGTVVLRIFDVQGHIIETLVNEVQAPGIYKVSWQPEGLTSGTYLYKLESSEFQQTRKLTLIK